MSTRSSSSIDEMIVSIVLTAAFTGVTALMTSLLYRHERLLVGHGQAVKIRRGRDGGRVGPSLRVADQFGFRLAMIHVFNRSDRFQTIDVDTVKTRIVWPPLHPRPIAAQKQIEIDGDDGVNLLYPFEAESWPRIDIDPVTGLSRRRFWLHFVGITQNGRRLTWFGPVHLGEPFPYRQPPGTAG
jgi:hypothetical protein